MNVLTLQDPALRLKLIILDLYGNNQTITSGGLEVELCLLLAFELGMEVGCQFGDCGATVFD